MKMLQKLGNSLLALLALAGLASAQKWQPLNHPPSVAHRRNRAADRWHSPAP